MLKNGGFSEVFFFFLLNLAEAMSSRTTSWSRQRPYASASRNTASAKRNFPNETLKLQPDNCHAS